MNPTPPQRPALQRAADSDIHPVLPAHEPIADLSRKAGFATSDALRPKPDKPVVVAITMPKSLRKTLRSEAARRGMSVDDLVVALLRDRTAG